MYAIIGNNPESLLLPEINKKSAYKKLPSAYRNDSCMLFYMSKAGTLYAETDFGDGYFFDGTYWLIDDVQPVYPEYWNR